MLGLFKRWRRAPAPAQVRPAAKAARPALPAEMALPDEALPVVVAEGNDHTDWGLWEDSMTALDSQMQNLLPASRIYVREARPSQFEDADPFLKLARR